MIRDVAGVRIFVRPGWTDMHKQVDGLGAMVRDGLRRGARMSEDSSRIGREGSRPTATAPKKSPLPVPSKRFGLSDDAFVNDRHPVLGDHPKSFRAWLNREGGRTQPSGALGKTMVYTLSRPPSSRAGSPTSI